MSRCDIKMNCNKTPAPNIIHPPVLHDLFILMYQQLFSQSAVGTCQIYLLHQAYFAKGDPGGPKSVFLNVVNIFQHTLQLE